MKIGLMIDGDELRHIPIENIKMQFENQPIVWVDSEFPMSFIEQDGFDLVVLDYGGISIGIGNSLSGSYANYVNKYAEDHPNTLIIYVTAMGREFLRMEGVNFEERPNITYTSYPHVRKTWDEWLGKMAVSIKIKPMRKSKTKRR